jgi:hypothetical protein
MEVGFCVVNAQADARRVEKVAELIARGIDA